MENHISALLKDYPPVFNNLSFKRKQKWRQIYILLFFQSIGFSLCCYIFVKCKEAVEIPRNLQLRTICGDRGRIISRQFQSNAFHVKTFTNFVKLLNETTFQNPPKKLPVFSPGGHACPHTIVPEANEDVVANYIKNTAFARPILHRIGYTAHVRHSQRESFEKCMGYEIIHWHTRKRREDAPFYIVKTHSYNVDFLDAIDMLTISDYHYYLLTRALTADSMAISPPYPLMTSKDKKLGVGIAFPVRNTFVDPNATAAERREATNGIVMATVDFEASVDGVLKNLLQGSHGDSTDRIIVRVYDISSSSHPIPLYHPQNLSTELRSDLKPPGLLNASAFSDVSGDVTEAAGWYSVPLDLGDPERFHEIRCKYDKVVVFPAMAVLLALGVFAVYLLILQVIWSSIQRFLRMKKDHETVASLVQAAKAGNVAKSVFLATMTQEARTPMNGLISTIHQLLRTPLDALQMDYMKTAEESSKSLNNLINDVLDFAKIESGNFEMESFPFNVHSLVDEVLGEFASTIQERQGSLELSALVYDSVPETLIGSPVRLRQILLNVVGNAIKFTPRGHVFVTLRLSSETPKVSRVPRSSEFLRGSESSPPLSMSPSPPLSPFQSQEVSSSFVPPQLPASISANGELPTLSGRQVADGSCSWASIVRHLAAPPPRDPEVPGSSLNRRVRLLFCVEDTGIGIPEHSKDAVFEPFAQLDTGSERRYSGMGIGLSLSKRLVHLMNGKLSFVSKERVGTTFHFDAVLETLEFPKPKALEAPWKRSLKSSPLQWNDLKGKKVLVVDGKLIRQQVLASYLRRLQLVVGLCDNFSSAVLAVQSSVTAKQIHSVGQEPEPDVWDFVLVDVDAMGPTTGLGFGVLVKQVKEVKHALWAGAHLPRMVLVAASVDDVVHKSEYLSHFLGTILKPLRTSAIASCLQTVLSTDLSNQEPPAQQWARMTPPPPVPVQTPDPEQQLLGRFLEGKQFLVVDSDLFAQRDMEDILYNYGVESLYVANNPKQGMQRIQTAQNMDCAVVAFHRPLMSRLEFLQWLWKLKEVAQQTRDNGSSPILIFILLEKDDEESKFEFQQAGLEHFLVKPLDENAVGAAFSSVFGRSDSTGEQVGVGEESSSSKEPTSLNGWLG